MKIDLNIKKADHHCHMIQKYYENVIDEIKKIYFSNQLEFIISMGLDYETSLELINIKKQLINTFNNSSISNFFKIGIGLHPQEIVENYQKDNYIINEYLKLEKLLVNNLDLIDYIGEVGIDLYYESSKDALSLQVDIFKKFCNLSQHYKKPLSIHSRNSTDIVLEILENDVRFVSSKFNGYLHCFTGNFEQGKKAINMGLKLGIGGIVTYKSGTYLIEVMYRLLKYYKNKRWDDIFGIETDSPYLSPEPLRNDKNNPCNVLIIRDFVIKNLQKFMD